MSKRLFSYLLFFLPIALYGQELKPYEEIGKSIQMNQSSVQNPVYNVPCGTPSKTNYFQSAIYVGDAVTSPLFYFTQDAPGNYYINCSRNISTVEKGKSFELRLALNKNASTNHAYTTAFGDWDRDGEFETNFGENQVMERNTSATPSTTYQINIPTDAKVGKHRIRVYLTDYSSAVAAPTAPVNPGLIYDFIFFVTESTNHDGILVNTSSSDLSLGQAIITTASTTNDSRYAQNSRVTVKALKEPKATFVGWSDGTKIVSTDIEYTFSVNTTTYLIAIFDAPVPLLEAPQSSTNSSPIWYQIKIAQTDSRLDSYIAYEENPISPYTTKIHLEKPADTSDKFLWRLEKSSVNKVRLISKNGGSEIFSNGSLGVIVNPSNIGSDFLVKPSGHANGSYSILYNGIENKLLNGDPQWKILLYNGGIGTGSGWYFYRVPDILLGVSLRNDSRIRIHTQDSHIVLSGTNAGEIITIYNLLGQNILSSIGSDSESRIPFKKNGIFIITVQNKKEYIHTQKIII